MRIILNIFVLSVSVFIVAEVLKGIKLKSFGTAIIVAIVYGLLSWALGGIFRFIAWPLMVLTFGLFKFVINAVLLWLTDMLVPDFEIKGVGTLLLAALLITLMDSFIHWLI